MPDRNPERVLRALAVYLREHPGQRVGQAIVNNLPMRLGNDAFYVEDNDLATLLEHAAPSPASAPHTCGEPGCICARDGHALASAPEAQTDPLAALVRRFVFEHPEQPGTLLWGKHTLEDGAELGMDPDDFALEADRLLSAAPAPQTEGVGDITADGASTAPGAPEPPCGGAKCWRAPDGTWVHSGVKAWPCDVYPAPAPSPAEERCAECGYEVLEQGELHRYGWTPCSKVAKVTGLLDPAGRPPPFYLIAPSPAEEPKPAPSRETRHDPATCNDGTGMVCDACAIRLADENPSPASRGEEGRE